MRDIRNSPFDGRNCQERHLHWFETLSGIIARTCDQAMSIVRYADDFVILAREWKDGFREKIEKALEERFELVVNRDKTRLVDLNMPHESIAFLGYEFRFAKDRFGRGGRYLEYGPSRKSVKKVREKVKEITLAKNGMIPVEETVKRLNKVLDGWGRYFKCGHPSRMFGKVNWYVSQRLRSWMNRRSQRGYRLRYADSWYGEFQHLGLLMLTRKRYWQ